MQQLCRVTAERPRINVLHLQPTASAFGRGNGHERVEKRVRNKQWLEGSKHVTPGLIMQIHMANA